jgi:hypothetical protein
LGTTLSNLALLVRDRGGLMEARQLLQQAVQHQQAALARRQEEDWRRFLRIHYENLAKVLWLQNDHAELARVAPEIPKVFADENRDYCNAARFMASCVTLAEQDGSLTSTQRMERIRVYADSAIEFLRQAVQKGYKNEEELRTDAGFNPLRPHEEFRNLLAELKANGRPDQ